MPDAVLKSTSPRIGHPELATPEGDSIDSETLVAGEPKRSSKMHVAPNRPRQSALRSFRRHQLRKMPNKDVKSTSPEIGHVRGRFDRFGNAGGRTRGPDRRRPESADFESASLDSEI